MLLRELTWILIVSQDANSVLTQVGDIPGRVTSIDFSFTLLVLPLPMNAATMMVAAG